MRRRGYDIDFSLSGVGAHHPRAWYKRTFDLAPEWRNERVLLHFGAVDYRAEVDRCYDQPEERMARWAAVEEVVNFAENYARRKAKPTLGGFLEDDGAPS